eukprot:COSAG01_NODE_5877_length_3973_cov_2.627001_4_plen_470_part_00
MLGELAEARADDISGQREYEERLELALIVSVMSCGDPADFKYLPRLHYLLTTASCDKSPQEKFFGLYLKSQSMMVMGDMENYADAYLDCAEMAADLAKTHPQESTRNFMLQLLNTLAVYQFVLKHERWDWEKIWGENGALLVRAHDTYRYDLHHHKLCAVCMGIDMPLISNVSAHALAYHFGNFTEAQRWMKIAMQMYDRVDDTPMGRVNKSCYWFWSGVAQNMGQGALLLPTLVKAGLTWEGADKTMDEVMIAFGARPRGDQTMGLNVMTVEHCSWGAKLSYALLADVDGTPEEIIGQIPSVEDMIPMVNAGLPFSLFQQISTCWNIFCLAAEVCEKFGQHERALVYAVHAATNTDITKGGCLLPGAYVRGYRVQGRSLAAQGKLDEAEAALESAGSIASEVGLFLLEVLAMRDLKLHVLDQTDRSAEGTAKLKAAIVQLLGATPDPMQLAELAHAVGPSIDLALIMS